MPFVQVPPLFGTKSSRSVSSCVMLQVFTSLGVPKSHHQGTRSMLCGDVKLGAVRRGRGVARFATNGTVVGRGGTAAINKREKRSLQ